MGIWGEGESLWFSSPKSSSTPQFSTGSSVNSLDAPLPLPWPQSPESRAVGEVSVLVLAMGCSFGCQLC